VPALQKMLVRKANDAGKLSIVATQMLESMISHPQPTRAEASDVANAIYDGADVVMLSGESAVGLYPVETVTVMADIIRKAEKSAFRYRFIPHGLKDTPDTGFAHALARAAHDACEVTGSGIVIVYTMTGWSARVMSKYRPRAPIVAMTPLKTTYHQLALYWGMTPMICPLGKSTDEMLAYGERILLKAGLIRQGETMLVTAGGTAKHKASNMLKVHVVGSVTYR
jgi:pyruvate kinase